MLEFLDRPRAVRVYRREARGMPRAPIATVSKISLAVTVDKGMELTPKETEEVSGVIELLNAAENTQRKMWALKLPVMLREALEYCLNEATDVELKLVANAVAQAQSQLVQLVSQRTPAQFLRKDATH